MPAVSHTAGASGSGRPHRGALVAPANPTNPQIQPS